MRRNDSANDTHEKLKEQKSHPSQGFHLARYDFCAKEMTESGFVCGTVIVPPDL